MRIYGYGKVPINKASAGEAKAALHAALDVEGVEVHYIRDLPPPAPYNHSIEFSVTAPSVSVVFWCLLGKGDLPVHSVRMHNADEADLNNARMDLLKAENALQDAQAALARTPRNLATVGVRRVLKKVQQMHDALEQYTNGQEVEADLAAMQVLACDLGKD